MPGPSTDAQLPTLDLRTDGDSPRIRLWWPAEEPRPPDVEEGTVVVALPRGTSPDPGLIERLVTACTGGDPADPRTPVGVALADTAGRLVHAGTYPDGFPVGHGASDLHNPLYTAPRPVSGLSAPFAWSGTTPEIDLSGPLPTTIGRYLGGPAAVTTASHEELAPGGVHRPDLADLAPDAVLILDPDGKPDLAADAAAAATSVGATPVLWGPKPESGASSGVMAFGPSVTPAGLAHGFGPVAVVHLGAGLLEDPGACEALLRAAPSSPVGLFGPVGTPGRGATSDLARDRSEVLTSIDDLTAWLIRAIDLARDLPSHRPNPAPVAAVPTEAGLVSIVIPVHGQWDLTRRCLESIRRHTPEPFEIIVVDDASPDDTAERLSRESDVLTVTVEHNLGFPGAVNRGLVATSGEFVCILNNDTEVTPGWLSEMLAALEMPGTAMVGPRSNRISGLQGVPDTPPLRRQRQAHHWASEWARSRRGVSWRVNRLVGFCLVARRELFERLGGLDEGFGRGNFEDDELSDRILAAGGDLRVVDGSVVLHHGSATFASLDEDYLRILGRAARNRGNVATPHSGGAAVVVLSDGDPDSAARSVWSVLRISDRVRIVERAGAESTHLAVARARHLGVEVLAADWRTPGGAGAAFDDLSGTCVVVLNAGEIVSHGDLGRTRATLEAVTAPTAITVDGRAETRICPLDGSVPPDGIPATLGSPASEATDVLTVVGATATPAAPAARADEPAGPGPRSQVREGSDRHHDHVREGSDPHRSDAAGIDEGWDEYREPASLRVLILAREEEMPLALATAATAATVDPRPNVLIADREGEAAVVELEGVAVSTVPLDWTDPVALGAFLTPEAAGSQDSAGSGAAGSEDRSAADTIVVLRPGEFLLVDPDAWEAERCLLPPGPVGVMIGDRAEVRIHPLSSEAVGAIGSEADVVTSAVRIVPADLPGGPAMAALFPEVAAPSAVRLATAGVEPWTEKLLQTLALDEEQRVLHQIRSQPGYGRSPAGESVGVVVPLAERYPDSTDLSELNVTLAALLGQSHEAREVVVTVPGTARLESRHPRVTIVPDFSITPDQPVSEVISRLADLGAALVTADWVTFVEPGLVAGRDHLALMVGRARAEGAEMVGATVSVEDTPGRWRPLSLDRFLDHGGAVSGTLFRTELAAIGHHPNCGRVDEGPGRNRLQRLRLLGVTETTTGRVTLVRPLHPTGASESPRSATPALAAAGNGEDDVVRFADPAPGPLSVTGTRLHLGCGPNKLPGWVNVDIEEQYEPDLRHDLSQGLPYADGTVDAVYSEHFFEHLTLADGVGLMAECLRVLRRGGVLRIAMPDLTTIVEAYRGDWRDQAWLAAYPQIRTAAQMLNTGMRAWEHRYLYDLDDLTLRLRDLGFVDVTPREWGRSDIPELRDLETRDDSRLIVEAVKP